MKRRCNNQDNHDFAEVPCSGFSSGNYTRKISGLGTKAPVVGTFGCALNGVWLKTPLRTKNSGATFETSFHSNRDA
jgi:hypothetical protein